MLVVHCKLAAALALVATGTLSSVARSQEPVAPPDAERATSPRSPVDIEIRGAPDQKLFLCKEVTTGACRGVVAIPARSGREPRIEGWRWRTELDRETARVMKHGPKAGKISRKKAGPRAPMQNGFEPAAIVEPEFRREILVFLADVLGERSLRSAGTQLPRINTIRAMAEVQALEESHRRATYIQTEEFKGNDESITTAPAMLAGTVLLGTGLVFARVGDFTEGEPDSVRIRPQVWPPGIRINGTFDVP